MNILDFNLNLILEDKFLFVFMGYCDILIHACDIERAQNEYIYYFTCLFVTEIFKIYSL